MGDQNQTKWHTISASDVLKKMKTSEKGLSTTDAAARIDDYGLNEFKEKKKISKFSILLNQFKNTLVIILLFAGMVSLLLGSIIDTGVIFAIVIINAIIGFRQEYNAEKALEALKRLTASKTIVIRNGTKEEIESKFLVPGDIVVLEEGTKIPADIRILESSNMKLDESSLTGESTSVNKKIDLINDCPLPERENMAYMGTILTYGRGSGVVVSTGMKTEMGKIAEMIQEVEEEPTPLQKSLARFGKNLTIMIIAISVLVAVLGVFRGGDLLTMFLTGIALAVAAIPEGLPAVVTITLTFGIKKMAKKNAIVRRLPSVESLGSVSVICSDKTGTLTRNEMTVRKIYYNDKIIDVEGEGYEPTGEFLDDNEKIDVLKDKTLYLLLKSGFLCNNAELKKIENTYSIIGDPTEGAIVTAASKAFDTAKLAKDYPRVYEIPFSSERKMMSVITSDKKMHVKGAPEIILDLCTQINRNGKISSLTKKDRDEILSANYKLADKALRIIAIAYRDDDKKEEKNLIFLGLIGMIDPPRQTVKHDIDVCKKAGIMSVMITGDHKNTAVAIAKEIGLLEGEGKVLTGKEMESISDKELFKIVKDITVYARVDPIHKLKIVEALQKHGEVVAMTGDGVNDAPALKRADIGISMGIKGTDVSKEASDIILKDDNFSTIVIAVKEGRRMYDNIKKFIQYLLSSNLGEVLVILFAILIGFTDPTGEVAGVIVPLTVAQILWMNLVTDGLPATALGLDPAAKNIMRRQPRDPKEKILSKDTLVDIIIVGLIIAIGTLFIFYLKLPQGVVKAQTVAFTMLVIFEMVRVQSVRMKYHANFFSNKKLLLAIAISIILQFVVIYVPYFQVLFGTTALGFMDWIEILMIASTVMIIMVAKSKIFDKKTYINKMVKE